MLTYLYTLDYDDGDAYQAATETASQYTDGLVADSSSELEAVDDETVYHHKRMNNVRVYALAEKYGMPALKKLAETKFKDYETSSRFIHNQEVINAIFDSTPDTDSGLRNIVIRMSVKASKVVEILGDAGLAPVIRHHGSFGLGMLREVIRFCYKLEGQLHHELEIRSQMSKDLIKLYKRAGTILKTLPNAQSAKVEGLLKGLQQQIGDLSEKIRQDD